MNRWLFVPIMLFVGLVTATPVLHSQARETTVVAARAVTTSSQPPARPLPTSERTVSSNPFGLPAALPAPDRSWRHAAPTVVSVPLTAKAAIAVDLTHEALLYAEHPDVPLPPASTSKIVTALVAVRVLRLNDVVEVELNDLVDASVYAAMGLLPGDQVSVEGLLTGLLVASAGDAANALARVAGQRLGASTDAAARQRFVAEMNRLARELGMRRSRFVVADGRDMPGQVVTARDLAIATQALFRVPELERIVAMPAATVRVEGPNTREIRLLNTNQILGLPGVHGVKTGTTAAAGQCLVAAVWRGDARVITVVLGSRDRYADTAALLAWLDQHYRWVRVGSMGGDESLQHVLRAHGLTLATTKTLLLSAEEAATLEVRVELEASHNGRVLERRGAVVLLVRGQEVLRLPLYVARRFAPAS